MESLPTSQGEILVPLPGLPGFTLIISNSASCPPAVIDMVHRCLTTALSRSTALSPQELRDLLRLARRQPSLVEAHPRVRAWMSEQVVEATSFLAIVRQAIAELAQAQPGGQIDPSGAILQMRYLEGDTAKEARQRLFLSESHYHRLQSAGLQRLAEALELRRIDQGGPGEQTCLR